MKKPSDFICHPFNSVLQKTEAEIVARNIMIILKKTGNEFRELDWYEYKKHRLLDGAFSEHEKHFFEQVIKYCKSSETAILFSPEWNK